MLEGRNGGGGGKNANRPRRRAGGGDRSLWWLEHQGSVDTNSSFTLGLSWLLADVPDGEPDEERGEAPQEEQDPGFTQ